MRISLPRHNGSPPKDGSGAIGGVCLPGARSRSPAQPQGGGERQARIARSLGFAAWSPRRATAVPALRPPSAGGGGWLAHPRRQQLAFPPPAPTAVPWAEPRWARPGIRGWKGA